MLDCHRKTIENLKAQFINHSDYLAFIVIGSVARDEARPESDLDFYLVMDEQKFADCSARNATSIAAHQHCAPPCTEANGYLTSLADLTKTRDHGNEIDRWTFTRALVVFSRNPEIEELVAEIPCYREQGRTRRMESFHSQMYYHISFFEFAYYSQTKYLIYETATKLILSIGRLILADNRILYPNRKWFFRELKKAPDKPAGICEAMDAFLDAPTIEAGRRLIRMVEDHKAYPLPPEGMKSRIDQECILNLEEW